MTGRRYNVLSDYIFSQLLFKKISNNLKPNYPLKENDELFHHVL